MPGQTRPGPCRVSARPCTLQWRAGQLPGQTRWLRRGLDLHVIASMEGRTIARPDHRLRTVRHDVHVASMEGRTIARPDGVSLAVSRLVRLASMEGGQLPGTIARCFNGGPDNCPARRAAGRRPAGRSLQWRAGQLPGQTHRVTGSDNWPDSASMEGRTIARPDRTVGAAQLPVTAELQWRAGQLPGQTTCPGAGRRPTQSRAAVGASMEGRTIARPDLTHPMDADAEPRLQWRAGQLPGQTWRRVGNGGPATAHRRASMGVDNCPARPPRFNGGPDNCPARPALSSSRPTRRCALQWRAGQLPGQTRFKAKFLGTSRT